MDPRGSDSGNTPLNDMTSTLFDGTLTPIALDTDYRIQWTTS